MYLLRFTGAPAGFHPKDVYRSGHSVLVIAKPLPSEVIMAGNAVTYSNALNNLGHDVDQLAVELCLYLEKQGVRGIAVPTNDPYDYWDAERSRGWGFFR